MVKLSRSQIHRKLLILRKKLIEAENQDARDAVTQEMLVLRRLLSETPKEKKERLPS